MYLEKLSLLNFKNYPELNLEFHPRVNVFVGKNGSGKTNILDSIYFLALTKSAFSSLDNFSIRHGENFFMVKGTFQTSDRNSELVLAVQSGAKKVIKENGISYDRITEHIGKYPVVLIAPDDTEIVKEGSELRRRFFDGIISQLDKFYLDALIKYSQALKNRNMLLKMFADKGKVDYLALESYDNILVDSGNYIYKKRQSFLTEFQPEFRRYYAFLVSQAEETSITYSSQLHEVEFDVGLRKNHTRDIATQRSGFGIHRDDFEFRLGSGELKRFGSQGQQKSFVIALKLSQVEIIKKHKQFYPVLLLDDIFDKLDDFRINQLLELIKQEKSQMFITDARPGRTADMLEEIGVASKIFKVEGGRVF